MEMNNEKTIEINKIPSLTWNWMKMNKDLLTLDFSLTSLNPEISMPAAGSDFNKADVPLPLHQKMALQFSLQKAPPLPA